MNKPCGHLLTAPGCSVCRVFDTSHAHNRAWGGPGLLGAAAVQDRRQLGSCVHLGKATGDSVECGSCPRGKTRLKVHGCAVHGLCVQGRSPVSTLAGCDGCTDRTAPEAVCLDLSESANGPKGIGDHLTALTVAAGWKRDHPAGHLTFVARPWCRPWVRLFGGYDHLTTVPPADVPRLHDASGRGSTHYTLTVDRLPVRSRALPEVLPLPAGALEWASRYRGAVALCPRTLNAARDWLPSHWLRLEGLLLARGVRCVVLGAGDDREALACFRSPQFCGQTPARVAALLTGAACAVANESGLAHLAGALGVPCVVVAAQFPEVHRFWPRTTVVRGPLSCTGCHTAGPHFRTACQTLCASLQAIGPEDVLAALLPHLPAPVPRVEPAAVLAEAEEFPAGELAALWAPEDAGEALVEWMARYAVLWRVVRELAPRRIVEIGCRAGYSAWTMLRASPGASVLSIDLNVDPATGNSHGGYLDAWRHAARINAGRDWTLLIADSHRLDRLPEADLVYVDGDHEYSGCFADLILAERSGARAILCDDYSTADLPVRAAIDAWMSSRPHLKGLHIDNGSTGLYLVRL